jgi:uncharacterized membrane protein YfcA
MFGELPFYMLIGFVAQMVDGAIGMAFGVISTSALLTAGVLPAPASAAVHFAKIWTGAASGYAHWRIGNVDWRLCRRLALPGILGAVIGALVVGSVPAGYTRPVVSLYLIGMAGFVLVRAFGKPSILPAARRVELIGGVGGLVDAMGGGWGPVVTTTLLAQGGTPRMVVGSVNLAELAVSLFSTLTFLLVIGSIPIDIALGLILGGVLAAPFAALAAARLPARLLQVMVALTIVVISARTLYLTIMGTGG